MLNCKIKKLKYIYYSRYVIKIRSVSILINSGMHFKVSLQHENGYKLPPSPFLYEDLNTDKSYLDK